MKNANGPKIAVIGMGPRGLGALEALADLAGAKGVTFAVDVFDDHPSRGAGPNFDPGESRVCLLNIPMRDIDIRPPGYGGCGSFAAWMEDAPGGNVPGPDVFPRRTDLGSYLEARWAELEALGVLTLSHHAARVDGLRREAEGWKVRCGEAWCGPYGEVLLTLGQPEVEPDEQLADWQDHAARSDGALWQAYPARDLQAADWAGAQVAIRGMALSAFDILRVLSIGQGGRFEAEGYVPSGREPARIIPFSLNGQPPFPKPETQELDARFAPSEDESEAFSKALDLAVGLETERARAAISGALEPVVARLLRGWKTAERDAVARWLEAEWDAPGSQEDEGPLEVLQAGIEMAEGRRAPTIGYVVGQVWRKWQDRLRRGYNPAGVPPETAKSLVGFDEGLKRYSYGPPVSSSREMAALIEAGIVDLGFAADPEIEMVEAGWRLESGGQSAVVGAMIDGVMAAPDPEAVTAAVVSELCESGRIVRLCEGLSAHTGGDGQLIGAEGRVVPGLSLLGRLSLGSVIAADSLHDCFGEASARWAQGVMERAHGDG
ncbi:FAD/NAD(P)-binding protein [Rhodalgimonas zhirmunskyi]|uniref:FAD/NAD(P)-binding protein n=1 Tax=Rhodalgimonas zhirmunskyi TaxID=2964767 RepID=UPI002952932E|nr:FAD/NAD(P)-binding protein [Rhodoalgimonas zhirmunskyi]